MARSLLVWFLSALYSTSFFPVNYFGTHPQSLGASQIFGSIRRKATDQGWRT